ncbi:MAG: preprotein translocase subunit SecE [Planctomycetota bacterium]|nr:preprotein translocase subunit SecE [Planctomycetota bacterium]
MAIQIYKGGQGRYTRVGTAVGVGMVILILAYYAMVVLDRHLPSAETWQFRLYIQYGAPALLGAALVVVAAMLLNKPNFVDFLIATESEMKKVSWSNRAELLGSTTVVIVTVFLMAFVIWVVDMAFVAMLTKVLHLW